MRGSPHLQLKLLEKLVKASRKNILDKGVIRRKLFFFNKILRDYTRSPKFYLTWVIRVFLRELGENIVQL